MTRTTKILLAGGATALVLTGLVGVGFAEARGWNCGLGRSGPGPYGPPGAIQGQLFENYDANEDGKLTQAEVDQVRAERFATFDADGNESLTLEEYEALWLDAMREAMVDRFQNHDADGDGQVTVDEFGERSSHLVQRFDRDGDGEVTQAEMRPDRRGWGDGDRDDD